MKDGSISVALVLLPAGAVLTWAIQGAVLGVDVHYLGLGLLAAGALAVSASLVFFAGFAPLRRHQP
jgi:hypothetical protein